MADFQTPCPLRTGALNHITEVSVLLWDKLEPVDRSGLSAFTCTGARLGQMQSYPKVEGGKKVTIAILTPDSLWLHHSVCVRNKPLPCPLWL